MENKFFDMEKEHYFVTFKWPDTDNTYCTNLVIAYDEEMVREVYTEEYGNVIDVRKAEQSEIETAEKKGMPVVDLTEQVYYKVHTR